MSQRVPKHTFFNHHMIPIIFTQLFLTQAIILSTVQNILKRHQRSEFDL